MSSDQPPIHYGMFLMPVHDPNKPLAQCYDEDLELVGCCEELGFDEFWVGEHHSSTYENIVMPEIFIAKAMGMTRSIRMGPAPVCLQFHHPLHVAGRLAFLDHLSHGRLNLCFGVGAIPTDAEMFDVPPKQAGKRVSEALDAILKVWTSEPPYEFHGEFWNWKVVEHVDSVMGLGQLPKPLQRPHPPLAIPCISRDSFSMGSRYRVLSEFSVSRRRLASRLTSQASNIDACPSSNHTGPVRPPNA